MYMLGYAQKFLIRDILLHLETHFKQETETSCISDTNFSIQKTQLQLSLHVMETQQGFQQSDCSDLGGRPCTSWDGTALPGTCECWK